MAATVAAGLASRAIDALPTFVIANAGDALWSVALYWTLAFIWPTAPTSTLAVAALLGSFADEFSQMLQWPWLVAIRRDRIGHLLLGTGFDPVDLIRYTLGTLVAAMIDRSLWRSRPV